MRLHRNSWKLTLTLKCATVTENKRILVQKFQGKVYFNLYSFTWHLYVSPSVSFSRKKGHTSVKWKSSKGLCSPNYIMGFTMVNALCKVAWGYIWRCSSERGAPQACESCTILVLSCRWASPISESNVLDTCTKQYSQNEVMTFLPLRF